METQIWQYYVKYALWQLSVEGWLEIDFCAEHMPNLNARQRNLLAFAPILSQGLCTNEAENTVFFLCGANVY